MVVEIKFIGAKPNLNGYTLIEGFPGIGLVGTIAVGYLAEKYGKKNIGYIYSEDFPPLSSIHAGKPLFPARIYVDKEHKLVYLFSEFVVPAKTVHGISNSIIKFIKTNKIKQVISLAGMTTKLLTPKAKIFGIASNPTIEKQMKKLNVEQVTEGITTGVSGILLAQCVVENIPAMSLLIETSKKLPDPRASVQLLERLEQFLGWDIKTDDLQKEAQIVENKMKKIMSQVNLGQKKYAQAAEPSPMYG